MIRLFMACVLVLLMGSMAACSKSKKEEVADAIEMANMYLTDGNCAKAIEILEQVGRQTKNAAYISTLSSAYACRAGFSEVNFFASDVSSIPSASTSILGGFTKFTTSKMSSSSDAGFNDLQTAIDLILYAGEVATPSHAARAAVFNSTDMGNLNVQALYMVLAQLGKYLYYYGNANPIDGLKGGGAPSNGNTNGNTNKCFYTYAAGEINPLPELTTPCVQGDAGHPDLTTANVATNASRMCRGVVLFNTAIDLLTNTVIAATGSTGNLVSIGGISTFFDAGCTLGGLGSICTVKSQTQCEADHGGAGGPSTALKKYFGFVFEFLFRG